MYSEGVKAKNPTSPVHDNIDVMFQAVDMVASFWMPFLKATGRWQLEMSQLGTKQTRAMMKLGHQLAACHTQDHFVSAYREYWNDVSGLYSDVSRNIATALVRAAPHAAVLQLPLVRQPHHDTIELIDANIERRKVA